MRRSLVDLRPLPEALADLRLHAGVAQFLCTAYSAADGDGPANQCWKCLCCLQPWTPRRSIAAILRVEELDGEQAMMAGICAECAARPDLHHRILQALQRDLGVAPEAVWEAHTAGMA